jgi:two-component system NtrC family sensor kinase
MTSSFPMADTSGMAPDAALAESRRFLKSTLDALSAHIAILDEHGTIIEVNAAWIRFARENDFNGGQHGLGDNYLKICGAAVGDFSAEALAMAKGIRAVMAGESDEFSMEYPCHSSRQQRWFIGRATRFTGEPGRCAWLWLTKISLNANRRKMLYAGRLDSSRLM